MMPVPMLTENHEGVKLMMIARSPCWGMSTGGGGVERDMAMIER